MKNKCVLVMFSISILLSLESFSQQQFSFIPSAHLSVTSNKTTNLIFPYSVKNIDRGSKDILVQQPGGTENIVQVKAGKINFAQTNLSVITIDGKLYSFIVDYSEQPGQLNIVINNNDSLTGSSITPVALTAGYNEAVMKSVADKVLERKGSHIKGDKEGKLKLKVNGIYVNNGILYFRLKLQNKSNIGFDADNITFSIRDHQKSKRTATQELALTPVYTHHAFKNISAGSSSNCVIAFSKFTLAGAKYLSIQLSEKGGSRNLHLHLENQHIMNAVPINY
jgi:conjugative transposon TraN protein